jgi:hypothetical protein
VGWVNLIRLRLCCRLLTTHQSMNGLPRCGVLTLVRDRGAYSVGRRWVMRYRLSRPPMEWASMLMPRPLVLTRSCSSSRAAREATDPVLRNTVSPSPKLRQQPLTQEQTSRSPLRLFYPEGSLGCWTSNQHGDWGRMLVHACQSRKDLRDVN